jgi:hypothetical protein
MVIWKISLVDKKFFFESNQIFLLDPEPLITHLISDFAIKIRQTALETS